MRPHALLRVRDHVAHRRFAGDVGGIGLACALAVFRRHRAGLLRRGEIAIDREHARALLREADDGRPPVAQAGAGPLPGADDDGGFVAKAHDPQNPPVGGEISIIPMTRRAGAGETAPFSLRSDRCAAADGRALSGSMNDSSRKKPGDSRTISIRGAREHNLKNVDVDIPRDQLVVFTGLSGSGKSSLAFDTIYAEGQRRYVESRCRPMRASSWR